MVSADIPNELSNLPLEFLISAPMVGAIKAQAMSAKTTKDFIQSVGFNKDNSIINVPFSYDYPAQPPLPGKSTQTKTLNVPLLSLIPIPYIRIQNMTIDFDFKVNTTASDSSETDASVNVNASASFWVASVSVSGSFSHKSTSDSTVTRSAEMHVTVNAVQDQMPGGLQTVLNILQQAIVQQAQGGGAPAK